eukprot:10688090-Prorocentrum_lima.AAC.1
MLCGTLQVTCRPHISSSSCRSSTEYVCVSAHGAASRHTRRNTSSTRLNLLVVLAARPPSSNTAISSSATCSPYLSLSP